MKTLVTMTLVALAVGALGCVTEKETEAPAAVAPAPPERAPAAAPPERESPRLSRVNTGSLAGTVEAIDVATRSLTLRNEEGPLTVEVRDGVPGFETLQVGDRVKADFIESTVVWVAAPGEPAPTAAQLDALEAELPAGGEKVTLSIQQVTATIDAIDVGTRMVTLEGPEGRTLDLPVEEDVQLEKINVGDQVTVRITQTLAVAVEKVQAQ
jgi:hypothetical protein